MFTIYVFFVILQMYQDGSARPMTAVKAAGYTSSLSRGEFKVVCFIYCLLRVDNDYDNNELLLYTSGIGTVECF